MAGQVDITRYVRRITEELENIAQNRRRLDIDEARLRGQLDLLAELSQAAAEGMNDEAPHDRAGAAADGGARDGAAAELGGR